MGTGQMLLSGGAIILLSLVILRFNNSNLTTSEVILEGKMAVMATSLATSIIEEAKGKSFDTYTDTSEVTSASNLSTCGKSWSETYPGFNDFDDYNGLIKYDTLYGSIVFKTDCVVEYINPSSPDQASGSKTFHKRMKVKVYPLVQTVLQSDTVEMSTVYSYWFFR